MHGGIKMRVKLLIATVDILYAKLISDNISEFHADKIDISICSTLEGLQESLSKRKYDVVLLDAVLIEHADTGLPCLRLLLWSEADPAGILPEGLGAINKYQRISSIVSSVLERFAKESGNRNGPDSKRAKITAVWSPAGGVGKTSVAIAYALSNAIDENEVFYLNLEDFTSVPGYFDDSGKSISNVFEMLENNNGNVKMLIQGVSSRDNGLTYLCSPDNYEDMFILSGENVNELILNCSELSDELVIDLSCSFDTRTRKVFELADNVLIVTAQTSVAKTKLAQFISQNNVFESIKDKVTLVANKGAVINEPAIDSMISLPYVQANDTVELCRKLSETVSSNRKVWLQA